VEPTTGVVTERDVLFASGERRPELRLAYTTLGEPRRDASGVVRNAVLVLHGTGGSGQQFLTPEFAGELFGPGQPLDAGATTSSCRTRSATADRASRATATGRASRATPTTTRSPRSTGCSSNGSASRTCTHSLPALWRDHLAASSSSCRPFRREGRSGR
jgi:hypothetical protein